MLLLEKAIMRVAAFILALALYTLAPPLWASPDASRWQRMTLLGTNEAHYFAYVAERENPGSYYDYTTRVVIEKYHSKTNRRISRNIIQETAYHLADPESGNWTQQDKKQPPFDLSAYYMQQKIYALFPESCRQGMGVAYNKGGLYVTRGKQRLLLRKLGASRLIENENMRIADVFIGADYAFIVVQQGKLYEDMDYIQKVLPVSLKIYRQRVKQLFAE